MAIKYKGDIMAKLKAVGFSSYRIRQDRIFGEATVQKIRSGEIVSWENINSICKLLNCQVGDILQYVEDNKREPLPDDIKEND